MNRTAYLVVHTKWTHNHPPCGNAGMLTTISDPVVGDVLMANDFFHLDGKPFEPCEEIICDNCGKPMMVTIESIDYENSVEVETHGG